MIKGREKISNGNKYIEKICLENDLEMDVFWKDFQVFLDKRSIELDNLLKGNSGGGVPILHSGEVKPPKSCKYR